MQKLTAIPPPPPQLPLPMSCYFKGGLYATHLSCPIDSLPEQVLCHTLTHMHTCIRFVSSMSTAALFLAFSFILRIVSGIGIAMFSTASYTLLTQFFATKKGSIVVSETVLQPELVCQ